MGTSLSKQDCDSALSNARNSENYDLLQVTFPAAAPGGRVDRRFLKAVANGVAIARIKSHKQAGGTMDVLGQSFSAVPSKPRSRKLAVHGGTGGVDFVIDGTKVRAAGEEFRLAIVSAMRGADSLVEARVVVYRKGGAGKIRENDIVAVARVVDAEVGEFAVRCGLPPAFLAAVLLLFIRVYCGDETPDGDQDTMQMLSTVM